VNTSTSPTTLRRLLLADAAISGITGLVMLSGAGILHEWFEVPAALIRYAGLALLPFAAMVLYFSRSHRLSSRRVWTVIVMNLAWVAASVLLLLSGWIDPNVIGVTFVLAQALAVAVLAEFQYATLRAIPVRLPE
jgi:hypothetical protein